MKEIDFLPQWYRQSKRHQSRVRRQYTMVGAIFLLMVIWNSMALRSINEADAQLTLAQPQRAQAEKIGKQFRSVQHRWDQQGQWLSQVKALDTHLDTAAVLVGLSHLIGSQIEVQDIKIVARPLTKQSPKADLSYGPVAYRCTMQGTSKTPEAVGKLITAMEGSALFQEVQFRYAPDPNNETLTHYTLWCDLTRGDVVPLDRK